MGHYRRRADIPADQVRERYRALVSDHDFTPAEAVDWAYCRVRVQIVEFCRHIPDWRNALFTVAEAEDWIRTLGLPQISATAIGFRDAGFTLDLLNRLTRHTLNPYEWVPVPVDARWAWRYAAAGISPDAAVAWEARRRTGDAIEDDLPSLTDIRRAIQAFRDLRELQ